MNSALDRFRNLSPKKRALARQKLQAKAQSRAGAAPAAPRAKDQPAPLSFPQQRLWFLDQMEGGSAHYNEFGALRITGRLDVSVLSQSINHIICRHEVLRTTFAAENGVPVQIVHPPVELPITVVDLSNLSPRDQQAKIESLGAADAQLCFDLTRGPLLRMTLLRLAEQSHVLLLTIHHIVCDLWSMAVLNREFKRLYAAFSQDLPADLPLLSIQYADFACWQWAQHDAARQSVGLDYWRQRLAGDSICARASL